VFDLRASRFLSRCVKLELDVLAHPNGADAGEPEAVETISHDESLRVIDDGLQRNDDLDGIGHPVSTPVRSIPQMRRAAAT